jgi:hypothetical protein
MFTHFARAHSTDDLAVKTDNIIRAERHLKRSIIDCYKYLGLAYGKRFQEFSKNYQDVNLGIVKDGKFLPAFTELVDKANGLLVNAKVVESKGAPDEEVFFAFEESFLAFRSADLFLNESHIGIENAANITRTANANSKKFNRASIILAVCSVAIGIIGTVVGILGFLS